MWSIRIAQASTALFALGHTIGMFNTAYRDDAERAAVAGIKAYTFNIMGVQRSHWDFYQGMGFSLSLFLIFCVVIMQVALPLTHSNPVVAKQIYLALAVVMAVMAGFCVRWFFPAPLVMSSVAAISLGIAVWSLRSGA
jgi:hypothetical protein